MRGGDKKRTGGGALTEQLAGIDDSRWSNGR